MSNDHSMPAKSRLLVEQAIDDAMDDLAQRNEARTRRETLHIRTPRERYGRIALAIAIPVFVGLVVWNVTSAPLIAARVIGTVISRQEAEIALKVVVDDIEAFADDYGEMPVSLAEVGLPTAGKWHYTRIAADRYRLDMSLGGQAITFTK